jgi:hypothetical protein
MLLFVQTGSGSAWPHIQWPLESFPRDYSDRSVKVTSPSADCTEPYQALDMNSFCHGKATQWQQSALLGRDEVAWVQGRRNIRIHSQPRYGLVAFKRHTKSYAYSVQTTLHCLCGLLSFPRFCRADRIRDVASNCIDLCKETYRTIHFIVSRPRHVSDLSCLVFLITLKCDLELALRN